MVKRLSLTLLVLGTVVLVGGAARPGAQAGPTAGVTMHEWGTFTTVAGPDGHPIQWLPLGGPADLPCFVDHFQNRLIKIFPGEYGDVLDYQTARSKMMATVRMETPVMYFYASQPATLNVSAKFKQGMFTEWYPKADVNQVDAYQNIFKLIGNSSASIAWKNVEVRPGATAPFATTDAPSHYYKARETDATPVDVGGQAEKFLFYRGLGQFAVPISTELVAGGRIIVRNDTGDAVPEAILFTNERGKIGTASWAG